MSDVEERALLAGGCFWGMQELIRSLPGVVRTRVGYSGDDDKPHPTYRDHGRHAESIEIVFDPTATDYRAILEYFFQIHDPTTKDRQGADVGSQYRSILLWHSTEQRTTAEQLLKELETDRVFGAPIVTEVVPFRDFFPAEAYHQGYYRRNPAQGYCRAVISPKVAKFRKTWAEKLRA